MPKTGFVHCVDAFAFENSWDMQPGDWDQLRGLIQSAATGITLHPLVAPLALLVPPGPPFSNLIIGQIVNDQIVRNVNPGTIGLCGGMTFAAADYYEVSRRASTGLPCSIGLVGTTPNPMSNHQVLVTGYDDPGPWGASSVRLYVYEPNKPNVEQTIDFDFGGAHQAYESTHAAPGRPTDGFHPVRGPLVGFFAAQYSPQQPPPALVISDGLAAAPASRVDIGAAEQFTMTVKNQSFGDTPPLKLYVAGRAGAANVDPGGEPAAARIPMNEARRFLRRTTIAVPLGPRHFFASSSVEPDASHQAWRLPADVGTGRAVTDLVVTDPTVTVPVRIHLKTYNGQYVSAERGGGGTVVANRNLAGSWETFQLVDQNGPPLNSGDQSALRADNGQFVSAEGGGGREVVANRSAMGVWETFTILHADGSSGVIANGQQVALRASNGQFVSAQGGGGGEVVANRSAIQAWETFTIEMV
jgi:hypothetical protein